MKRSQVTNTFESGMICDFNPLISPEKTLCNALNATLITASGNEYVLQNDMGNARVETAYLPEGYIPLGTTSLGGIIFVVSYNPLTDRSQVGCFPSPERNITSTEDSDMLAELTNADFGWTYKTEADATIAGTPGATVYYVKKELNSDVTFNPGDKFIICGSPLSDNVAKLYNEDKYVAGEDAEGKDNVDAAYAQTVRFSLGTITSAGKVVIFDNAKQWEVKSSTNKSTGTYCVLYEYKTDDEHSTEIDSYRNLVSQPYNIFSSKVSGSLIVVAELVQFTDFDVAIHNTISKDVENAGTESEEEVTLYRPTIDCDFAGDYPFVPLALKVTLSLTGDIDDDNATESYTFVIDLQEDIKNLIGTNNMSYSINADTAGDTYDSTYSLLDVPGDTETAKNAILNYLDNLEGYWDSNVRNKNLVLHYTVTPCMSWGELTYLAVGGSINLDLIGTGYIGLTQWRYYNTESSISLTWGLETYEEEDHYVGGVVINFYPLVSDSDSYEGATKITYTVDSKNSYFGSFFEEIPLGGTYYKLSATEGDAILYANNLYLCEIVATYVDESTGDSEERKFYRWLYTTTMWNDKYTSTKDYSVLYLDFTPTINTTCSFEHEDDEDSPIKFWGLTKVTTDVEDGDDTKTSLSAIQTIRKYTLSGVTTVGLTETYDNLFKIQVDNSEYVTFTNSDGGNQYLSIEAESSATTKYTGDSNYSKADEWYNISATVNDQKDFEGGSGQGNSDQIINLPTTQVTYTPPTEKPTFDLESGEYFFSLDFITYEAVKAFCTKTTKTLSYQGAFKPLAYDADTFQEYNIAWQKNDVLDQYMWAPKKVGVWGIGEPKRKKGRFYGSTSTWNDETTFTSMYRTSLKTVNGVSVQWGSDAWAKTATSGYASTATFSIHLWGSEQSDSESDDYLTNQGIFFSCPAKNTGSNFSYACLFMKTNDGYWVPINFGTIVIGRVNNPAFSTWIQGSGVNTKYTQYNINLEQMFIDWAQLLNNIYHYVEGGDNVTYWVPDSIYYMDVLTSTYYIEVSACIFTEQYSYDRKDDDGNIVDGKDSSLATISVKCIDGDYVSLWNEENNDEVLEQVSGKIGKKEDPSPNISTAANPELLPNIQYKIGTTDNSTPYTITSIDKTSGTTLRDKMLSDQETVLGIQVMDFDGVTSLSEINTGNAKTEKLYMRKCIDTGKTISDSSASRGNSTSLIEVSEDVVLMDSSFIPIQLSYWGGKSASPDTPYSTQLITDSDSGYALALDSCAKTGDPVSKDFATGHSRIFFDGGTNWVNTKIANLVNIADDVNLNMQDDFMLNSDGKLVLKDFSGGHSFKRETAGDTGTVSGYQYVGPLKKYIWY